MWFVHVMAFGRGDSVVMPDSRGFKLLWLREFRFDPVPPEKDGALAWSVLLERDAIP